VEWRRPALLAAGLFLALAAGALWVHGKARVSAVDLQQVARQELREGRAPMLRYGTRKAQAQTYALASADSSVDQASCRLCHTSL
jgi:hypothetical protein